MALGAGWAIHQSPLPQLGMVDVSHACQIGLERQVDHFLWRAHFGHVIGHQLVARLGGLERPRKARGVQPDSSLAIDLAPDAR
jgi:hypothetical protein